MAGAGETGGDRVQLPVGRVLVVDDDEDMGALVADALAAFGFITERAATEEQALARAKVLDPHVIVIDLHLGSVDGHDLGVRLRSASRRAVQLIALTGDDRPHLDERSRTLGFAAHIIKPTPLRDLARLIGVVQLRAGVVPE